MLAHIYAWRNDYANAHEACLQVINNGGYSLEPMDTYKNIWKGQSSQESIFEIAMTFNPNDPNFSSGGVGQKQTLISWNIFKGAYCGQCKKRLLDFSKKRLC